MTLQSTDTTPDILAARHSFKSPTPAQALARDRFEYQIRRLHTQKRLGRPRAHLEMIVRLCEGLLGDAGGGPMVEQYRLELGHAKATALSAEGEGEVLIVLSPVYYLELQLAAESERQRGWLAVCATSGKPRAVAAPRGELVYGPPGAHLAEGAEVDPEAVGR